MKEFRLEIRGEVVYDPSSNSWKGKGTSWWIETTLDNAVEILFEEPLTFDPVNPIAVKVLEGQAKVDTDIMDQQGFLMWCNDHGAEPVKLAFLVRGTQTVPNDRTLSTEDSFADIYAAGLLFDYEAKYGVVSVMGSASITSEEIVKTKLEILENEINGLLKSRDEEENEFKKQVLEKNANLLRIRMERHKSIMEKSTEYWNSAKKFGELWGLYSTREQAKALDGRYIPICTGGGPGIMQAVAEGARSQNAHVVGIDCQFGYDNFFDLTDSYAVYSNQRLRMNNFSIREGILINYSHVILFWPGGYGTAWEVFETLSKISTHHLRRRRTKAIFVHKEYWKPMFEFCEQMRKFGAINSFGDRILIPGVDDEHPDRAYLAEVVDSAEEAFWKTREFVETLHQRNELTLRGN